MTRPLKHSRGCRCEECAERRAANTRVVRNWRRANPAKASAIKKKAQAIAFSVAWFTKKAHRVKRLRNKALVFDLTARYLKSLYDDQRGLCAVTGIFMQGGENSLLGLSVDRIQPTLGYVKGNVRLVTRQANCAKLNGTDDDLFEFARNVIVHNKLEGTL